MRLILVILIATLSFACATSDQDKLAPQQSLTAMAPGQLKIQIETPTEELFSTGEAVFLDVEGVASAIGGVRHIDIMLVMDRSQSLTSTDPEDHRAAGAVGFVKSLSPKSDTHIGVVGFDRDSQLLQPLTADRNAATGALQDMARAGGTNIAAGITTALSELQANGRPGSSRLIMLFTDGKSNQRKAREATRQAQVEGVTVHTMLLGDNTGGAEILEEIALATGGSFIQVTDPAKLPEAFLNLRTTGVEQVTLSANGAPAAPAQLAGGSFAGRVQLGLGENHIVARATSLDEQVQETAITINVSDASCAALDVDAMYEGLPAKSLNERAVEIVIDASRSMWGRMEGAPKMSVAKDILLNAAEWLPADLDLALRAYGSVSVSDANDCADSTLLVPFGTDSRANIRDAIADLKPKGQTPIAFALQQAAKDLAGFDSERTVVLVTDGIESCSGDPIAAASALRDEGIKIHVIGFGLGNAKDEDTDSLTAIAQAAGGRYMTAGTAAELKQALESTVGTPFRILQGDKVVAASMLGSDERIFLPEGDYRLELDSVPQHQVSLSLSPRDALHLTLEKAAGDFSYNEQRAQLPANACENSTAWTQRAEPALAKRGW